MTKAEIKKAEGERASKLRSLGHFLRTDRALAMVMVQREGYSKADIEEAQRLFEEPFVARLREALEDYVRCCGGDELLVLRLLQEARNAS